MSESLTSSRHFESTRPGFGLFRHTYVWLALTPFILLLLFFGYRGFQEWQADQSNQHQIVQWKKAGVPYDNASMQTSYMQQTFPEGHADWARVIRLTEWGMQASSYSQLPYVGHEGKPPEILIPNKKNDQWADDALVAGYLEEMQPVIDLIEQASKHPNPVRFPMHFQGFYTLLPHTQSSRSIARILSLDCDYAYSHHDTKRALRDLSLMQSNIDAFDSRDFLVSMLVTYAVRGIRAGSIRRTLTHCVWDESQLAALRESMSTDEDIAAPFRKGILHERAMALASLSEVTSLEKFHELFGQNSPVTSRTILPSDIRLLTKYYDDILAAADGSITQWKKRGEEIERRLDAEDPNSIAGLLLPATAQCIGAGINAEHTRRWTLTAIVLRQYYQQHDSWPQQLSELETLGLEFNDYSNMKREMFGYEIAGDSAYLWKSNANSEEAPISSTRPFKKKKEQGGEPLDSYLLELHGLTAKQFRAKYLGP